MKEKTASQIMTKAVVTVGPDLSLKEAISLLLRHHISGMPVVDNSGKLVGIITEQDIINFVFSGNATNTKVQEAMTAELIAFDSDTDVVKIAECFIAKKIRRVPIVENGKVVGIISRRDILREMLQL